MSISSKIKGNKKRIKCLLGELFKLEYGKSLIEKKRNKNGMYPVLGSNGIIGFHDEYLIKGPGIVVGRKGAIGEVTFIDRDFWPIDTTYYLKVPKSIDIKFSFYLFKSLALNRLDKSTAIPGLNRNDVYILSIWLPPLVEQRAIVSKIEQLFSELDSGIENLQKARAQLKVYRQSVLKWAFEGKLTETWRKEQSGLPNAETLLAQIEAERERQGEKNGKKVKPIPPIPNEEIEKLPKLPEGWSYSRLGHIGEVVRGASPRPAGDPKYFGGSIPWITVGDLTKDNGVFLTAVNHYVTEEGLKKSRFIDKNTLLLTNSGATLGVPKITKLSGCINDGSVAILGLSDIVKNFLYWFLKSQTNRLRTIKQGAAQPNLNTGIVNEIIIPLCFTEEQNQIVQDVETRLSVCDKLEETIAQALGKADILRQSILKKAFAGELLSETELAEVRQAPDWEPAEKLLERIKTEKEATEKDK